MNMHVFYALMGNERILGPFCFRKGSTGLEIRSSMDDKEIFGWPSDSDEINLSKDDSIYTIEGLKIVDVEAKTSQSEAESLSMNKRREYWSLKKALRKLAPRIAAYINKGSKYCDRPRPFLDKALSKLISNCLDHFKVVILGTSVLNNMECKPVNHRIPYYDDGYFPYMHFLEKNVFKLQQEIEKFKCENRLIKSFHPGDNRRSSSCSLSPILCRCRRRNVILTSDKTVQAQNTRLDEIDFNGRESIEHLKCINKTLITENNELLKQQEHLSKRNVSLISENECLQEKIKELNCAIEKAMSINCLQTMPCQHTDENRNFMSYNDPVQLDYEMDDKNIYNDFCRTEADHYVNDRVQEIPKEQTKQKLPFAESNYKIHDELNTRTDLRSLEAKNRRLQNDLQSLDAQIQKYQKQIPSKKLYPRYQKTNLNRQT